MWDIAGICFVLRYCKLRMYCSCNLSEHDGIFWILQLIEIFTLSLKQIVFFFILTKG